MESSWATAEINMTCLEEALAVAGGYNYALNDSCPAISLPPVVDI